MNFLNFSPIELHKELAVLKVEDMIKQETLSFVYQYVHIKLPNVFRDYFLHRQSLHEMIEEKRKRRFIIPRLNAKIGERTIKYSGTKLFNENAQELNLKCTIKTFRKNDKINYLLMYVD